VRIRAAKVGFLPCQRCGLHATLRSLDIAVPALPARKATRGLPGQPAAPAGWCPLIALCGLCWTDAISMLRAEATPDIVGTVSPV